MLPPDGPGKILHFHRLYQTDMKAYSRMPGLACLDKSAVQKQAKEAQKNTDRGCSNEHCVSKARFKSIGAKDL